jgi:NitT/TauT family transport system permease protein
MAMSKPGLAWTAGRVLPIPTVLLAVLVLWYAAAVWLNAPQAEALMDPDQPAGFWAVAQACWSMDRPVLPAPDQIASALVDSVFNFPLSSPRNLLLQAGYTAETAFVGLVFGLIFGILLAIGIVHVRTLDRSVMPWVIASQTGDCPDAGRRAGRHGRNRPAAQGSHRGLSYLLSGDRRHGEGLPHARPAAA